MADPVFKPYDPNQATFLPPSLDELIGPDHQVRFIASIIDQMDISDILCTYEGGGTSSYHPRMLLKILIYGYVQRIYSCRQLAKATRENIAFMWLGGGQRPDFRTINNFRKDRLPEGGVKAVFTQVMLLLVENGLVDLREYSVDGTTLEANARKHSAVWAKNTERYRHKAIERIEELFDEIQRLADLEEEQYGDRDLAETGEQSNWNSTDIEEAAERVSQALREKADDDSIGKNKLSKAQTRLRRITDKELPKVKKYEQQQRTLDGRGSYSRTDPDATFMRLKDQSPFDKLLAPAYNLQMGTQNQFILGYSLHSNAADKVNLESHLDQLSFTPRWLCADAGYGSLANYELLGERDIEAVVKFPGYDRKPGRYSRDNFEREPVTDTYRCPEGRVMHFTGIRSYEYGKDKTTITRRYECEDCIDCPVRSDCCFGPSNRTITFNHTLEAFKKHIRHKLATKSKAKALMRGRGAEIEAVFGQLKHNDMLRRLNMRGNKMVELEVGLKAIAHNLRKMEKMLKTTLAAGLKNTMFINAYEMAV